MNPDHVAVVMRGPAGIADWRKQYPKTQLDLRDADLRTSNLAGTDLREACLTGARLSGADLRRANLREAMLVDAQLDHARLTFADLSDATLSRANLSFADLAEVRLTTTRLDRANLTNAALILAIFDSTYLAGADLSHALMGGTVLADLDLGVVKGLETVGVDLPCTVGVDTLYLSKGKIPESFLVKCGVPDGLIKYLPSLLGMQEAIQFYSCFISFSFADEEFCKRLHSRMRDEHLRVWFAPEDMAAGRKVHEQIDEAIRVYDKLLLVLSEASMASEWVKTEVYHARQREAKEGKQVLFPIGLVPFEAIRKWKAFDADTGKDMAREVREYFIPDFSNWKDHDAFEGAFKRLLKDLRASAE